MRFSYVLLSFFSTVQYVCQDWIVSQIITAYVCCNMQASERILRFVPKADYSRGHRVFGSEFIASAVYDQLNACQGDIISSFLHETKHEAVCKSLHGFFYEKRILERFTKVAKSYDCLDPDHPGKLIGNWTRLCSMIWRFVPLCPVPWTIKFIFSCLFAWWVQGCCNVYTMLLVQN